ncbi:MAG TPA: hypothetical protein HA364_07835 [Thermoplasmata archaeon]|nr:hypothetical protein [Thermoplasmata archaeon]
MALGQILGLAFAAALLVSSSAPFSAADDEQDDYAMFHSVDETKVSIISGNLTIAVTRDWPRMVFQHSYDPFSPTFDIGFPKLYLFNDTDGDGRFCRSEALYTVFLDSNRVEWNLSSVESGFTSEKGEFVMFSMSAQADAYNSTLDAPPSVESWANMTFWFCLTENEACYENPAGMHIVSGKTGLFINMSVEVTNRTETQYLAVERFVQGGATTNMFHLLEDGPQGAVAAALSARVDESLEGEEFTRPLNGTASPVQCIDLAKEDGTVQAFYQWGSAALDSSRNESIFAVNSSCYTTGIGLILHSVLPLSNGTLAFTLDSSLGIVESGFAGSMTDWLKENSLAVAVTGTVIVACLITSLHVLLRRRRLRRDGLRDKDTGKHL